MSLPETTPPFSRGEAEVVFARAITIAAVEIQIDPETRDRIFIIHSEDEPTIVLRVPPMELAGILARLALTIARSLH